MTVIVRLLSRRTTRSLQPIDEAAAYARCHGERGADILRVERHAAFAAAGASAPVTGESVAGRLREAPPRARSERVYLR